MFRELPALNSQHGSIYIISSWQSNFPGVTSQIASRVVSDAERGCWWGVVPGDKHTADYGSERTQLAMTAPPDVRGWAARGAMTLPYGPLDIDGESKRHVPPLPTPRNCVFPKRCNSSVLATELPLLCTDPLIHTAPIVYLKGYRFVWRKSAILFYAKLFFFNDI